MATTVINEHEYGAAVTLHTRDTVDSEPFTDAVSGVAVDPDVVNLTIKKPDGSITTYSTTSGTTGTDAEITQEAIGVYSKDIVLDQHGVWAYRFWTTGTYVASKERKFKVKKPEALDSQISLLTQRLWKFDNQDQIYASNTIVELVNFDGNLFMDFSNIAEVAIASGFVDAVDPGTGTDNITIGTIALPQDEGNRYLIIPVTAYAVGVYVFVIRAVLDNGQDIVRKAVLVIED